MKRQDFLVIAIILVVLVPFFIPATGFFNAFCTATAAAPYAMAFVKFALLATFGEMLALRIRKGVYWQRGFGLLPRMVVWGLLGICIAMAMTIFKSGVPNVLAAIAGADPALLHACFAAPNISWGKVGIAFAVSVAMNTIFAPVMMTFHKCTDIHIQQHDGSIRALVSPLHMGDLLSSIDWHNQWHLVFARTIPLFWYPAHTITFLLPPALQVLFAALLGVALGLILALAGGKSKA